MRSRRGAFIGSLLDHLRVVKPDGGASVPSRPLSWVERIVLVTPTRRGPAGRQVGPYDSSRFSETNFGVIAADADGRVEAFEEKPAHPTPMPEDPARAFASMGNYIFTTEVLLDALREAQKNNETDFGGHVLPRLLETHRLFAYDFSTNEIPGIRPYEQRVYWRDVGTIDAYFDAHKDVLGGEPVFDMFNPDWPVYSSAYQGRRYSE